MTVRKILFVCMGNICRSPTAEGAFTQLVKDKNVTHLFEIDSAGTHAYHIDEAPDLRSQRAAKDRGIDLSQLRARQVIMGDFDYFDLLLAMDDDNYDILERKCPAEHKHKVKYLMDYAPNYKQREVPDPYYGGSYGFERVLDMVSDAAEGLLAQLLAHSK